jgi:hypothetical protein
VVTSPVRGGRFAYRFEAAGQLDPWGSESCELSEVRSSYRLGRDEYYGLSIRFQSPWSEPYRWGSIAQFAYPVLAEAPVGLNARAHDVRIAIAAGRVRCYGCSGPRDIAYNNWPGVRIISPLVANRWYDLIIRVKWETRWTGVVQVWRRSGNQAKFALVFSRARIPTQQWLPGYVNFKGETMDGRPHLTEDKIGLYRAHNPLGQATNAVYEDNFYVGRSWHSIRAKFRRTPPAASGRRSGGA